MADTSTGSGGTASGTSAPVERTFDINSFVASILAQNAGDKDAALRALGRDAKKARDGRNRYKQMFEGADAELKTLKKDGTVILSAEDGAFLKTLTDSGIKLKDVKPGLDELVTLRQFKESKENEDNASKACKVLGWTQPSVLLDLLTSHGLIPSFKKEKVKDGDKEEMRDVPYVQKRGDPKAVPVQLAVYAEEHFAKPYHMALNASDEESKGDEDMVITPVPGSGPANRGKSSKRDVVGQHLASTYRLPDGIEKPSADTKK